MFRLWCLEHNRNIVEARVVHKPDEEILAEISPAQWRVAVNPTAEFAFGVVEMNGCEIACPDNRIKLAPGSIVTFSRRQIIACGERMACIDTHAHPALVVDSVNYPGSLSKSESEVRTLSGCVLDYSLDIGRFIKCHIDGLGNEIETGIRIDSVKMASGMEIQQLQPEKFAAPQLIGKCVATLCKLFGIGRSEINELTVVRQNEGGRITA